MFALLSNFHKLNPTKDKPEPTSEVGSGAAELEEASGAGVGVPAQEARTVVAAAAAATVTPDPTTSETRSTLPPAGGKPESRNDIPEERPDERRTAAGDTWTRQLEEGLDADGLVFSGNGLTELETRHDFLLRSGPGPRSDLPPQPDNGEREMEEDDLFLAQGYPHRVPQTARPTARAAGSGAPRSTATVLLQPNTAPSSATR
ncbi:uncharacterized protein LOC114911303 [Scleropages formosus]|uniref:uncharacterized protein LOC114911303 n=1 Tax=Scleropages formosus TaxID=113540 RepID=UPI0010FAA560|nr:uncharacterized protein LOC114911303 [Scleropages formosus]